MFDIVERGDLKGLEAEIKRLKPLGGMEFEKKLREENASKKNLLHIAAQAGHMDIVRMLLLEGLSPDSKDSENKTPLDLAKARGHKEIAALLRTRLAWQGKEVFSMSKVLSYITDAFDKIKPGNDKNLALVIGMTGAGKSTLLNYVLGTRYSIRYERRDAIVKPRAGSEEFARVGKSTTISETLYPQVFAVPNKDFVLCDLAGFFDTRGNEASICAASSTQMLTRSGREVKAAILVLSFDDLKAARASAFKDVSRTLSHVLKGDSDLIKKSIYFVFTKAEGYTPMEIIECYVDEQLDHPTEGLIAKKEAGRLSDEDIGLLNVLMAMRENRDRILIPDITDDGQSASAIIDAIESCVAQPTNRFSFMSHDNSQAAFNEVMFKVARAYLSSIKLVEKELPEAIEEEEKRKKREEEAVTGWKKDITERENEKAKPFDASIIDKKIQSIKEKIKANKASIASLEEKVRTKNNDRAAVVGERNFYDTDDKIHEATLSFNRSASFYIDETKIWPFTIKTERKPEPGTENKPLSYNALYPLCEAEPGNLRGGSLIASQISGGEYKGVFRYERGQDSSVDVKLYSTKKVRYADLIKRCNASIEQYESTIKEYEAENKRLHEENTSLDKELETTVELKTGKIVDHQKRLLDLEAEIAERQRLIKGAEGRITTITDKIKELQEKLSDTEMELLVNCDLFQIVYRVNNDLSIKDPMEPMATENFNKAFEERVLKKAPSTQEKKKSGAEGPSFFKDQSKSSEPQNKVGSKALRK